MKIKTLKEFVDSGNSPKFSYYVAVAKKEELEKFSENVIYEIVNETFGFGFFKRQFAYSLRKI